MQCQFIVSFQRPHLTSVQYATPCTYAINLSLQQQENIYSREKGQCTTSYPSRVQLSFSMLKTQEPVIVNDGCIKRCSGPLHPLHTQRWQIMHCVKFNPSSLPQIAHGHFPTC